MTIPLCSINGLKSTIALNSYVYRWFLFLILQPAFKARAEGNPQIKDSYTRLRTWNRWANFLGILILFLLAVFVIKGHWIFLALTAIPGILYYFGLSEKKKCVAGISIYYIERDFPPDILAKTTLYQIGEIYAERFQVFSLVDALYRVDKIYRFVLIFDFFLVASIVSIPDFRIREVVFWGLLLCTVVIVNLPFIYERIK